MAHQFGPDHRAELRKTRPAVIVNDDAIGILPLKVIVPITDWKDRYAVAPWMVRLEPDATNGLEKPSAADAFQARWYPRPDLCDAWRRFLTTQRKLSPKHWLSYSA